MRKGNISYFPAKNRIYAMAAMATCLRPSAQRRATPPCDFDSRTVSCGIGFLGIWIEDCRLPALVFPFDVHPSYAAAPLTGKKWEVQRRARANLKGLAPVARSFSLKKRGNLSLRYVVPTSDGLPAPVRKRGVAAGDGWPGREKENKLTRVDSCCAGSDHKK